MQAYAYPENNEIQCCFISYFNMSQLRAFGLILSISLPPQHSRCRNRSLLLNSLNSRLWSCQTFHLLILCNCPSLLLFTIKLLILFLLFVCSEVKVTFYIWKNRKIANINCTLLHLLSFSKNREIKCSRNMTHDFLRSLILAKLSKNKVFHRAVFAYNAL